LRVEDVLESAFSEGGGLLSLYESLRLVEAYGLPVARYGLAKTEDDAVELAEKLGYPVVLKVSSPDVSHKTDVGGVILGLEDPSEVRAAFRKIVSSVRERAPGARLEGIVVQEMVKGGYEVIIGGLIDPQFGPIVMVGMGGVYAEVYKDVVFELAPLAEEEALEAILRLKGSKILKGYRGRPPADLKALALVLSKTSQLVYELHGKVSELDLNPTFALPDRVVIADARIVLAQKEE